MSFTRNKNLTLSLLITIAFFGTALIPLPSMAENEIEIKGKISVPDNKRDIWKQYIKKLKIKLSGKKTGEAAETVNENDLFSFKHVNPEDSIKILWTPDESTKGTYVLFPFYREGKATELSRGLIRFRFRTMDWVLKELKIRASTAAIKGKIDEIDKIISHAKLYYEILSNNKTVKKDTIDRYTHELLLRICQKSEEQRSAEKDEFTKIKNVPVQRRWYTELLNITGDSDYRKNHPDAIIQALNLWIKFSRQSYTKYNKWSDRDVSFTGNLDGSFKNEESRDLLHEDLVLIANILFRSNHKSLKTNPFQKEGTINMNDVDNWIVKIN